MEKVSSHNDFLPQWRPSFLPIHEFSGIELRAAASISQLWRDQGKSEAARELLGSAYDWLSEGFDTPDLQRARALLDA